MVIHNPILTGSFTYNGADVSTVLSSSANITSINAATSSLNSFSASMLTFTGSVNTFTGSASTRLGALEAATASLYTATSSFIGRVGALESYTASQTLRNTTYATTASNTFTGTQYVSNTNNAVGFSNTTSSIYTDGGLQVTKDAYVSSSLYIKGNLTVYGTQSVSYITSSTLNISTNLITVNTSTPSVRFGGIAVQDSGSAAGLTGSLLWDSQNNSWLYDNPSGSGNYDSAMVIMGPRNSSALGSEQGLNCNYLIQGHGHHHTTSSIIYHDGTNTCIPNNLIGSTICTTVSIITGCLSIGSLTAPGSTLDITRSSPNPYNTMQCQLSLINGAGNGGSGAQLNFNAGGAVPYINGLVDGANSTTGAALTFGTACYNGPGIERVRITSGGCVGINTNNPNSLLEVQNCINTAYDNTNTLTSGQWLRISNNSSCTGAASGILFQAQGPGGGNGLATINGSVVSCGSMSLTFGTRDNSSNVTEKMRIVSNGTVAIGTQTATPTPHAGNMVGGLIVQGLSGCRGLIELWDATSGKAIFQQVAGTTYLGNLCKGVSGGDLQLLVNGSGNAATAAMVITCQGRVLINNSAQNGCADYSRMTISSIFPKTSNCTAAGVSVLHLSSCENDYPFGAKFGIYGDACSTNRYLSIQTGDHNITNQGNIVLQSSGGNVGIGMTTPQALLHIMRGSGNGAEIYASYGSCGIRSEFVHNSSGGAVNLRRESDGSVNTLLRGYGDSYLNVCVGNVGIGTTSPSGPLHIDGNNYQGSNTTNVFITDHGNQYCSNCEAARLTFQSRYWSGDNNVAAAQSSIRHGKSYYNGYGGSFLSIATSNIDGYQYERFKINHRGTVSLGGDFSGGDYFTLDTTPSVCYVPTNGQINFCYMSGMVVVNNWTDGHITLYLAGGGNTTSVGSATGGTGCLWYNPSIVGYSWSNTYGSAVCVGFFVVRTRGNA